MVIKNDSEKIPQSRVAQVSVFDGTGFFHQNSDYTKVCYWSQTISTKKSKKFDQSGSWKLKITLTCTSLSKLVSDRKSVEYFSKKSELKIENFVKTTNFWEKTLKRQERFSYAVNCFLLRFFLILSYNVWKICVYIVSTNRKSIQQLKISPKRRVFQKKKSWRKKF